MEGSVTVDGPTLGARIRTRREERGLSLSALAEQSGVSKGYCSQLENGGATNPSVDTLSRIADALGVALPDLLGEPRQAEHDPARLPRGLAEFLAERENDGRPLPPEDVEMLRGIFYRGRQPRSGNDWAFLYETIIRTIK
jgi:transcriptional regulator with XRE-family HTH domain